MPKWDQNGPTSTQKTYNVAVGDDYFYKQKTEVTGGTTTTADPVCLDRNKYLKSAIVGICTFVIHSITPMAAG
jgi:hypothetical protein